MIEHINASPSLKERHPYPDDYMQGVTTARNMFLKRNAEGLDGIERLNGLDRGALIWNFQAQTTRERVERLTQYLNAHNIRQSDWKHYHAMCEDWRQQRTMKDFFGKRT